MEDTQYRRFGDEKPGMSEPVWVKTARSKNVRLAHFMAFHIRPEWRWVENSGYAGCKPGDLWAPAPIAPAPPLPKDA